jgi:hypothetical protein
VRRPVEEQSLQYLKPNLILFYRGEITVSGRSFILSLMLYWFLSACSGDAHRSSDSVVRDSAGITIVENVEPQSSAATTWRLSAEPTADIGVVAGDPGQELFAVSDAIRLANGNIVVVNAGTLELRFFRDDGSYLFSAGRQGDGPGEFQSVRWVQSFGDDSIVAYDVRHNRLSYFSIGGGFGRSVTLKSQDRMPYGFAIGLFEDGTALWNTDQRIGQTGSYRQAELQYRFAADGESSIDSVGWSAGRDIFQFPFEGGSLGGPLPFGRHTQYAVHGQQYYVATNDTYEIKVYASTGEMRSVIRKRQENLPVTEQDLDAFQYEMEPRFRRVAPRNRQRARRIFEQLLLPETMPAFGRPSSARKQTLHVDSERNVWVLEYNRRGDASVRWTVFDPDGMLLGTLIAPDGLDILDIGSDYVIGVWRDSLDVEHVQLYDLIKP